MKILHLLTWRLNDVSNNLERIKEQGFTHIQLSPIQKTKEVGPWWLLYQPCSLTIGNQQIGTKEDLINLCRKAHSLGLNIIQDIVLRHVASDNWDKNKPHHLVDQELLKFVVIRPDLNNDNDRHQVTDFNCGMPMLNYEDPEYQKLCIRFLDELKSCGVDMFRLDQLKHYRLPEENGTFLSNVMKRYDSYGEAIFCSNDILEKMAEIIKVGTNGNIRDKYKMITWYESHDTYLNHGNLGYTKSMPTWMCINEYRIICENFPNALFYARPIEDTHEDIWARPEIKEININSERKWSRNILEFK